MQIVTIQMIVVTISIFFAIYYNLLRVRGDFATLGLPYFLEALYSINAIAKLISAVAMSIIFSFR
nr:MAG TPA: hypothetical protein [Caudoviricetes sp.]